MGGEHLLRFRVFRDHVFDEILTCDRSLLPRRSISGLRLIVSLATALPKDLPGTSVAIEKISYEKIASLLAQKKS